jgi:hypothetical protein
LNTTFALLLLSLDAAAASAAAPISTAVTKPAAAVDRVVLEVDHGPLLQQQKAAAAEKSGFFVREDTTRALRERHQVDVVDDPNAPAILVQLAWKDYENSVYRIEVSTRRPGEAPKLVESFSATCINNSALVDVVLAKLPAALEQLEQPAEQVRGPDVVEPDPEPATSGVTTPPPFDDTTKQDAAAMGPVGIVGIVVGVGGLGMASFGISRLVKGETRAIDGEREQFGIARDARPQGRAWLGAGVGAAAVGVTMLVVDLTVLRKRRAREVTVVPSVGPGVAGLEVQGRF